jgi:hypothetical protein
MVNRIIVPDSNPERVKAIAENTERETPNSGAAD